MARRNYLYGPVNIVTIRDLMPIETILKALIAFLPVITLMIVLYRLDSHKLVGAGVVATVFLAGAATAIPCLWINGFVLESTGVDFDHFRRYLAPLIEECIKASVVIYLFRSNRIGFLIDAAIIGFAVGAGFSLAENIYFLSHASDAHHVVWVIRGFGTAIMHGAATALFAIVSEVLTERHRKRNPLLYLPGLVLAFLLHSVYNHFPVSPVLSTAITLLTLPTTLFLLFQRNEVTIHNFLETDFAAHRRLLKQIKHGEFSSCEAGRFLKDMQEKLSAPVAKEMIDYFCLHTELVLSAETVLLAHEQNTDVAMGEDVRDKLKRMHTLEAHIGRSGLRALRQHLQFTAKDMWEIHLLEHEPGMRP